jgi:putative flippase GtrA
MVYGKYAGYLCCCWNSNGEGCAATGDGARPMKIIKVAIGTNWQNLFKFASVGASGAIINLLTIYILTSYEHLYYISSAVIAIETSILWNFILNTRITFEYNFLTFSHLLDSVMRYHLASLLGICVNLSTLFVLTEFIKINYVISEAFAILLAFGFNYTLSKKYVWHEPSQS